MEESKKEFKIYKYTNSINGKVYIGKTCRTLAVRAGYKGKNYEKCPHFWNAIKKYKWENFKPEILEEGLSSEEALYREVYWIRFYNSTDAHNGYNVTDKIQSEFNWDTRKSQASKDNPMKGKHHSAEVKKKMSAHHADVKGKNNPNYGKRYVGRRGKRMSEETKQKISAANKGKCKGRIPWNKGKSPSESTKEKLRLKFKGDGNPFYGKKHAQSTIEKMKMSKGKKVICLETTKRYNSVKDASLDVGIASSSICFCCKGKSKTAGGFHWKYLDELDNFDNVCYNNIIETHASKEENEKE